MAHRPTPQAARLPLAEAGVLEVEVPMTDEVSENFLEIREVPTGKLVTILELLSPVNKLNPEGRQQYLQKRGQILLTQTSLVEIDLLRAGEPMPVVSQPVDSDYRILVSRAWQRPRAQLYHFMLRQAIPVFPLPLLRLDYSQPPVPPLSEEDAAWAKELP